MLMSVARQFQSFYKPFRCVCLLLLRPQLVSLCLVLCGDIVIARVWCVILRAHHKSSTRTRTFTCKQRNGQAQLRNLLRTLWVSAGRLLYFEEGLKTALQSSLCKARQRGARVFLLASAACARPSGHLSQSSRDVLTAWGSGTTFLHHAGV